MAEAAVAEGAYLADNIITLLYDAAFPYFAKGEHIAVVAVGGYGRSELRMGAALRRTGVRVTSGMTGPSGRLNHFGHPEKEVRRYYVDWFKTFADVIGELGGASIGTQFAIFTYRDFDDPRRREALTELVGPIVARSLAYTATPPQGKSPGRASPPCRMRLLH